METSLHRQLKEHYAGEHGRTEEKLGRYRIDAICGNRLIEIQHGSLAAIRAKILVLLKSHDVLVVKPIVLRKQLIKLNKKNGKEISSRQSPKKGQLLDLFEDLVYFTQVFPHPRLEMAFPLVAVEETRYPGSGRRRWRRKGDMVTQDQRLVSIEETRRVSTLNDLRAFLPSDLPRPFDTGELAAALGQSRHLAQRMAYCLRETGAVLRAGKRGNAHLYETPRKRKSA